VDPNVAGSSPVGRPILFSPVTTMSWLQALLIGILQGVTEFFPVSSSAHLKLVKLLFGIETGESQVIFDLSCHFGTLFAILFFFRRDLIELFTSQRKKLGIFFLAMLPLIPFYFLLKPVRDFASQAPLLGYSLMATSLVLFLGEKVRVRSLRASPSFNLSQREERQDALYIGTAQATALIPGISRSALTISCARVLGWEMRDAIRFSFLLSIPTILAGTGAEMLKLLVSSHSAPLSISFSSCLIGFLSSLGIGTLVVRYAIRILEKGNLKPFAWYCLILGIATSIYLNT
jgi:undecaprenyl-diphosphatase